MTVSTKFSPPQFNNQLVDPKTGLMNEYWQRWLIALVQRLEAPASSTFPALATSPGIPGQIAFDATHVYVCIAGGTWVRGTLATF